MTDENLSELLQEYGYEGTVLFSNPSFCTAFVGVTESGNAVYSFDKMVEFLVENDGMSEIDAIEFIEYNTIRSLPYVPNAPIVLYTDMLRDID